MSTLSSLVKSSVRTHPTLPLAQMGVVAPNLAALIGDTVGARLISKAGSLTSLAKCPASTVQILGAEKVGTPYAVNPKLPTSRSIPQHLGSRYTWEF